MSCMSSAMTLLLPISHSHIVDGRASVTGEVSSERVDCKSIVPDVS